MGLERIAFFKQGVDNMYEIDEVIPVIRAAEAISGRAYGKSHDDDVRMRVVADHVRSGLMLIGGRGTSRKRGPWLRATAPSPSFRASDAPARASRNVALPHLLPASKDAMKASYPDLEKSFDRISQIAYAEEDAFRRTLVSGTTILDTAVARTKAEGGHVLNGVDAFALHDTYGFPIDLTLEMAAEQGLKVDEDGFRALMQEQRDRARADAKAKKGGHADIKVYQALKARGRDGVHGIPRTPDG